MHHIDAVFIGAATIHERSLMARIRYLMVMHVQCALALFIQIHLGILQHSDNLTEEIVKKTYKQAI